MSRVLYFPPPAPQETAIDTLIHLGVCADELRHLPPAALDVRLLDLDDRILTGREAIAHIITELLSVIDVIDGASISPPTNISSNQRGLRR